MMNKTLLLAAATAAMILALPAQGAGDPEAGQTKAAPCQGCHGPDGNSLVPQFPKLAGQGAKYIVKQLQDFKAGTSRNNATMTPFVVALGDQDMEDLAAYFERQTPAVGVADESTFKLGQDIYRGGIMARGIAACASCHGPVGNGNPAAAFPAVSGQHADYALAQLNAFARGERSNDPNAMMRNIAKLLTEEERLAVSQYMAGLH